MQRTPRFGVTLPQIKRSWEQARDAATHFDSLGYDHLWVCDHIFGVPAPQLPIFEAWTQLAAIGALTERAELGTLVTPPFFRNPGVFAKQLATLDHISGGRVIAGLGSGWFEAEFTGVGNPFPGIGGRMRALEETVEILRLLFREEKVSYSGEYFSLHDAVCEPKPTRDLPILIGGSGERVLLRIAARHADIWNNPAAVQGELATKVEALRKRCDEVGRDPAEIEISQQCVVILAADEVGAKEGLAKASKIYGGHMGAGLEAHGIWGTPSRVIDCIGRHIELGATMFVIEFFGRDTREPATLFAEEVMPAFASISKPGRPRPGLQ
jgi:alkanesulfonate monooxygenase SsuD/methylene tetrahydromethanopterin reductase-like flavin-dependent oxidoreductase (luciferase family)